MALRVCSNDLCNAEFETDDPRKKYCCRDCQVWHNNLMARERHLQFKSVNDKLRKNYSLLTAALDGRAEVVVPKADLMQQGFDFFFFTGVATFEGGNVPAVYDLVFQTIEGSRIKISRTHGVR